jgi:16S rRNA (cytidine1402-2'-O)-methyltransferase
VSGLPARPFTFVGFLPRKGRSRREWLRWLAAQPGTLVLFESSPRLEETLRDLHEALGPRPVAIARELTKRFEQVARGTLGSVELGDPRGEVTLVIGGTGLLPGMHAAHSPAIAGTAPAEPVGLRQDAAEAPATEALDRRIDAERAAGRSARDVARLLSSELGLARGVVYRRVIARERGRAGGESEFPD